MSDASTPSKAPKKQGKKGKCNPPDEFKWKKGQSGNPLGGKLHDPVKRAIKNLTDDELVEMASLLLKGNLKELEAIGKDMNQSVLKAMIASVAAKAINKGDSVALDIILNRILGKPKERIDHTVTVTPKVTYTTKWGGTQEPTDQLPGPSDDDTE